jgi:hypothetical protein
LQIWRKSLLPFNEPNDLRKANTIVGITPKIEQFLPALPSASDAARVDTFALLRRTAETRFASGRERERSQQLVQAGSFRGGSIT